MFKKDKIYYLAIIWLSLFMLGATPVFATNSISIEFGEVDNDNQTIPILYNSTDGIMGFQFFIIGMDVTDIFGGVAEENNFYLHQGSTCWRDDDCKDFVMGFSVSGSPIPPGAGTLFHLNYAEIGDDFFDENISVNDLTCLDITEGFFLDSQGNTFDVEIGECMASPIDCNGNYYGSAFYDDCGICSEGESEHVENSDMDCAGICFGDAHVDDCGICDADEFNDCFTYTIELSQGANLISFRALPTDISVSSIFSELGDVAQYIIAEGAGAFNQSGIWYGSLQQIEAHKGYWLIVEESAEMIIDEAIPTSTGESTVLYNLHYGNNLISYPFSAGQSIDDAIDEIYLNNIFAIASGGQAARFIDGGWNGSLDYLEPNKGYWLVTTESFEFNFNTPDFDSGSQSSSDERNEPPSLCQFTQSPYQAFYWTANADIDGIPLEVGEDWICAFYGDVCVGSREWSGMSTYGTPTDIPVMGFDDAIEATQNYIVAGEYPRFVIYDASEDTYYNANAYDNHIFGGALLAMYSVPEIKVEQDCLGELGGYAYEDNCGVCDLDPENDCPFDCHGVPGGEAFIDACGICSGGYSGHVANSDQDDCGDCFGNNADMDCNGDCGLSYGAAYLDDCGICSGGYSGHVANSDQDDCGDCFGNNADMDCNGDCFGDAVIDDCGVCSEGESGHDANSDQDCNGDCSGDAYLDDCGVCSEGESGHDANSDQDCNGDCSGDAYLDDCGVCSGGLSELEPENDQDCNGECFGPALVQIYYFDFDGDGLGSDISEEFCDVNVPPAECSDEYPDCAWVDNHADIDDNCTSNYHDCAGACDGTDMVTTYYWDNDGDGLGSDISDQFCSGEVQPGWVLNNDDEDDNCFSNIHDCAGVCDGDAFTQTYWIDTDGDGMGSGAGQQYCTTEVPEGWVLNEDDEDDDCYSNYHDCAGECNGSAQPITYCEDADGDELGGPGTEAEYCNTECSGIEEFCVESVPDGWVENCVDEDDNCYSNFHDCAGVCDGDSVLSGCDNACNSTAVVDCAGVCDGDSVLSGCDNACNSTAVVDCAGVCDGDSILDNCGVCDNIPENDCPYDCAGVLGGNASLDDCGVCTNADINCYEGDVNCNCTDCAGVPNGDSILDNCGACDTDPDNDCPEDCAGILNGDSILDNCGVCDNNPENDCPIDCAGEWGGNAIFATYYFDQDGDGLGAGEGADYCNAEVPPGWVGNNNDEDDDCYSNYHDCAGVCNGDAFVDSCDVCSGGNSGHEADSDIDCNGDCADDTPVGCEGEGCGEALEDSCSECSGGNSGHEADSDIDCNGDCFGDAADDSCGECSGGNSGHVADSDIDCNGDCFDEALIDECGVCAGGNSGNDISDYIDENDFSGVYDCGGDCFGEAFFETFYADNDGDSLGAGAGEDYCNAEVPAGWVGNPYDQDDNCYSNYHDCAGVCDGYDVMQTYFYDNDGDDLGGELADDYLCSDDADSSWVLNDDDLDDNCYSNLIDQCGVCDGDDSSCSGCTDQEAFNYGCQGGEIPPCNDDITIDDGSCIYTPENFSYHQSQMQAFYIIEEASIQYEEIEELEILKDWVAVFKDSVCVGSYPWTGYQTTIPAMGKDGTLLTENYLLIGDYPAFYIYDSSEEEYMSASVNITDLFGNEYNGWGNYEFFFVEEMVGQGTDCSGMELGPAFTDDCGICICGYLPSDETLLGCLEDIPNIDLDCSGVCEPSTPVGIGQAEEELEYGAFEDNCGECSGGSTDHIADSDELGCGCFNPPPEPFWLDIDSDGFGFGDYSIDLCLDNVTELYADNNLDTEPSCPNPDLETSMIDDCGDCIGLDVSTPNENMDLFGVCCEAIEKDLCGVCFGNDSYCNQPVAENQNIETQEDNQIQIVLSANDPNDDPIFYSIIEEPGNGILLGAGQNLIYIPNSNFNGTDSFTFTASDGNWTSELGLVTINVHPVNDPPEVIDIIITVLEDSALTFDLFGSDVDGDDLSYTLSSLPINGSATLSGNQVQYTPNPNYFGFDSLTYAVSDSEYTSLDGTINISITPVSDAPYLSSIPDTSIIEGETFYYGLNFGDADGDELFLFVQTDEISNAEIIEGILIITPPSGLNGEFPVTIVITDEIFSVSESFVLTVLAVNDPPIFAGINDQEINEDSELIIELVASDIDGDELTFYVNPVSEALLSIENNYLTLIPVINFFGEINVSVGVSDGELADSTEFSVNVLPVNDPPELINEIDNISVNEGAEDVLIILTEIFYDVENGSELAYSVSENVNGLSAVISESVLTLSFEDENFGSGVVEITASDNISRATASTSFNVEIIPIDDPPIVHPVSVELDEDTDLEITLTATDPEGYTLEYSIIQSPENGSLTFITGSTYLFTPAADYFGSDTFIFRVSDGENIVDETVIIFINAVNDNPYFITESLPDALENSEYEANILIDDVDNLQNELSLFIVSGPEWLELDGFVLGGTPNSNDDGYTDITLELSDGISNASLTMSLHVENYNSAPVVQDLYINVDEDSFVELTLFANDPEGSSVTYNYTPTGNGSLSGPGPVLIYIPNPNYYGNDSFTYSASDGDLESISATVYLNVLGVNDNPVSIDTTFEVLEIPYIVDFNTLVSDPDGDQLTILTVPPSSGETLNTIFGGTLTPIDYLLYEYNPPTEDYDADFMLYKASDGTSESGLFMVTFNLYGRSWSRDFPPTAFDDIINIAEDESKEITLVGFDVFYNFPLDGTENVNITQSPQNGSLDNITFSSESTNQLVRWTINYTPNSDYYGEDEIRYIVENPNNDNGASEEAIISININPVNDLPQLDGLADVQLHEDSGMEVYFSANDADNDLDYNVSSSNESIAVSTINDSTISIIPVQNYNGSGTITVTATELGGDELSTSQIFTVDVLPVNDDPVLTFIDSVTVIEDESAIVSLYATDVDYVSFTYSAVSNTDDIQVSISNNLLTLTSSNNFNGVGNILITVVDNEGAEDSQDVIIEFLPVNDAPVLSDISNITLLEDTSDEITLGASDVDSQELEFSATGSEHISVSLNENILSVTPTSEWSGSETINIIVSDGELSESSTVTVTVLPVNDPPVLSPVSNQDVDEDNSVDVFLNANDSDGDYLIYTIIESGGMGTAISGNVITLTPPENYYGETSITVSVNDGVFADSTDFTLTVKAVNDAPIVSQPLEDIELQEDSGVATVVLLSNVFSDVDGDSLYFSVELNITELVSTQIIGDTLFINTIENQFGGPVIATVTANDQISSTAASDNFEIMVVGVNDAPRLSPISDQEMDEDGIFIYSLDATDLDGDQLFFSANIDSTLGTLFINGNLLKIIPIEDYNGEFEVTVLVSDGIIEDSTDFTLTVEAVNDAPIVSQPLEDIELDEDYGVKIIMLSDVFSDVDGDNLLFEAAINLNGIIFIDLNGNNLYISTLTDQYGGPITITVSADDQQGATPVIDQFTVMITPINDPPVIVSVPGPIAWEDTEYLYQVQVEDIDNDLFYYYVADAAPFPDGMVIDSSGLITWTPVEGVLSSGLVVLYVSDEAPSSESSHIPAFQTFNIEVIPVNDPPEIISVAPLTATEDELYSYQVLASDSDDVEFGYTLTNQPMGMTVDSVGLILWTPVNGVLSSETVTISVNDGGEDGVLPTEQEFFIVVIPVNDPPVIISIPQMTEVMVSNTYNYQVLVEDIDDDEFSYVLIDDPQGMTIDEIGYLTWIPQFPGEYGPITILASDGGENGIEPASQEIFILVTPYTDMITMDFTFTDAANLISYLGIPGDSTLQTVLGPLGDIVESIIGEGTAASYTNGIWMGSLTTIKPTSGYWLTLNVVESDDLEIQYSIEAYPTDPSIIYSCTNSTCLISYVGNDGVGIGEALPDEIEDHITGIIGQGEAASHVNGIWMGSLDEWHVMNGYWIQADIEIFEFSFVSDGLVRRHYTETKLNPNQNLPEEFSYKQSTQQSFYFVDAVMVDDLDIYPGEWILATNNGTVVGAREWNGEVIDVPVMGSDGRLESSAYCKMGDIPEFKLYRPSTGELIDLTGEILSWTNNTISFVGSLENVAEIPDAFRLGNPYPNPFNPTTSITFDVASECELELSIFDIQGRLIEELVSGLVQGGYYEIQWNASGQASGMYFLRMVTPESAITQKLILMK